MGGYAGFLISSKNRGLSRPFTCWIHNPLVMPKVIHVQCPGCGEPFRVGRSMSQHLTRNLRCKALVNSTPNAVNTPPPVFTAGPHAPRPDTDSSVSEAESEPWFEGHDNSPNGSDNDGQETYDELVEPGLNVDSNLQNAIHFPVAFTDSAFHEVQLLKLLHGIGAPNYAFQSFMEWGRNCSVDSYHFQPCPQRYESQIRNLTQLVGVQGCRPTTIPVRLEPDNLTLDVVVFPFATMLSSLLNCPILNKLENLVVNPNDRFGRYESPDGLLDEVNSGQWYQDTYTQDIHDSKKEFLAPIIFTMDKTVISEASHLSVYVILFTTSIFNREVCTFCMMSVHFIYLINPSFSSLYIKTRNKALAWRPLAYIPDQDMYYSKVQREKIKAPVKLIRLFKLYSVALQSFIDAQKDGSMDNIYLVLGDKAKYVTMKIPLAFIIGDNQGGDNIAGRTCFYGIQAKRISRCCDATPDSYKDFSVHSCSYLRMQDIMNMVNQEQWVELEALYQAQFWNPFFEVNYGANPFGIFFAACPPEGLHALEQGIFKHILNEILGVYLKPEQIVRLDRVVQSWVSQHRQRLFRSSNSAESPRLMFKDGISSLANTPGCDRAGMVFALTVASLTRDGKAAFAVLDEDVTQDITNALEMLLCYWAWLKHDKYWALDSPEQLETVQSAVSTMLNELMACIPRFKGNGWNIPKMHEQLHVPYYIQMFGAHRNLHTGPTEHNHIELSKQPARRTQMRAKVFDWQVANRLVDKLAVDLADFTMQEERKGPINDTKPPDGIPHNSAVFEMLFWTDPAGSAHADLMTPKIHSKYMPSMLVIQCIYDFLMEQDNPHSIDGTTRIRCVTELRVNDQHLRANPVEKDGAWFDNIVLQEPPDEHGIVSTSCGSLKFMFSFTQQPDQWFGVMHPTYGFQPVYSVFSRMYRFVYEDDPIDILASPGHYSRGGQCWVLDDDNTAMNSCPQLSIVDLCLTQSHLLMVPYHDHSKFMIGIIDQTLWSDKFVSYLD
jgi:hypothetical protein